MVWELSAL
uniref:Uncharacterized protein n=1 Tax=Anguilla anguilla TaxID=7936 RepID=A0A0E9VRT4_ANGAN